MRFFGHNVFIPKDFEKIKKEKCFGKKVLICLKKLQMKIYQLRKEEKVIDYKLNKIRKICEIKNLSFTS